MLLLLNERLRRGACDFVFFFPSVSSGGLGNIVPVHPCPFFYLKKWDFDECFAIHQARTRYLATIEKKISSNILTYIVALSILKEGDLFTLIWIFSQIILFRSFPYLVYIWKPLRMEVRMLRKTDLDCLSCRVTRASSFPAEYGALFQANIP